MANTSGERPVPRTSRAGIVLLLMIVVAASGDARNELAGIQPATAVNLSSEVLPCEKATSASKQVALRVHLPPELESLKYTYALPITVGIPFPRGELLQGRFLSVVQDSATAGVRCKRTFQAKVTGIWDAPGDLQPVLKQVKWLLVDAIVQVEGTGDVRPIALAWDNTRPADPTSSFDWGKPGFAKRLSPDGKAPTKVDPTLLGSFQLWPSGVATPFEDEPAGPLTSEVDGAARVVLKTRGSYRRGSQRIGEYITRYTFYQGRPYMRVYHTLVWGRDDALSKDGVLVHPADEQGFDCQTHTIDRLSYIVPGIASGTGCDSWAVGLSTGTASIPGCVASRLKQHDADTVQEFARSLATPTTRHASLTGWARITNVGLAAPPDVFVGLRWAREQFPTAFAMGAAPAHIAEVRLLDGEGRSWRELTSNEDTLAAFPDPNTLIDDDPDPAVEAFVRPCDATSLPVNIRCDSSNSLSASPFYEDPTGIAKTYELLVWPEEFGTAPPADIQNLYAQGAIVAYADPLFVTRSDLPSPMSPCTGSCAGIGDDDEVPLPEDDVLFVERTFANAFAFLTREQSANDPRVQSRLGALNYGDLLHSWARDTQKILATGRYWANVGHGTTALPWLLWMRSGNPKYRDFAEANARHVMDVDTANVTRIRSDGKCRTRGRQTAYGLSHGVLGNDASQCHAFVMKTAESDGEALAYQLTGYERALDSLTARAQALNDQWGAPDPDTGLKKWAQATQELAACPNCSADGAVADLVSGEGLQITYRTLGELCLLHEVTAPSVQFPHLRPAARAYLDAILALQVSNDDWFHNAEISWLEHSLACAKRIFSDRVREIDDALARWAEVLGSVTQPALPRWSTAPTPHWQAGKMTGSLSLLSLLAQYDVRGDGRALQQARDAVYTEALAVNDAVSTTGPGRAWKGMGAAQPWQAMLTMRDWLAVLARSPFVTVPPSFKPRLAPSSYILRALWDSNVNNGCGQMPPVDCPSPVDATVSIDRLYAVKDVDEELRLVVDYQHLNGGTERRPIAVKAYAGDSTTPVMDSKFCTSTHFVVWRQKALGFRDTSGLLWCSPSSSTTPTVTENTQLGDGQLVALPEAEAAKAGIYRFDVAQTDLTAFRREQPIVAGAFDSVLIRRVANRALRFTGGAAAVTFTNTPRLWGHDKMTLAARLHSTSTSLNQVPVRMPDVYELTTNGKAVTATFWLEKGSDRSPVSNTYDNIPGLSTQAVPIVAMLDIHAPTGRVAVTICAATASPRCKTSTSSFGPGYHIRGTKVFQFTPPLRLGQNFSGTLDELRILDRVLSPTELEWVMSDASPTGPALWTAHERELGGGDVFLFDGSLDALSGAFYSTSGKPTFVDATGGVLSRPARQGKLVQYDRSMEPPGVHRPYDGSFSRFAIGLGVNAARASGVIYGTRQRPHHLRMTRSEYDTRDRFGVIGLTSNRILGTVLDNAAAPTPNSFEVEDAADVVDGTPITALISGEGTGEPTQISGLAPYFARSPHALFDPLSCESNRNAQVAQFPPGSTLELTGGMGVVNDLSFTLSFKMKASATSKETVMNKANKFVAETDGTGMLSVTHMLKGGGAIILKAKYPPGQWVTVTTTAEFAPAQATARLYFNGRKVQEHAEEAMGLADQSAGPLVLGNTAPESPAPTFTGLLDDVWVEASTAAVARLGDRWFVCESTRPAQAQIFESFEGACPMGVQCVPR